MKEKPKTKSDLLSINILIVPDTTLIKRACPNPSQDITKPRPIKSHGQYVFYGSSNSVINEKLTSKLSDNVTPTAILKFRSTSIYQNSSDAVIIYQVKKLNGLWAKLPFVPCVKTLDNAVQPDLHSASFDGLPALHVQQTFISCDSSTPCLGTESYRICFALYTLEDDGTTQN
jgi:hypothetical protein